MFHQTANQKLVCVWQEHIPLRCHSISTGNWSVTVRRHATACNTVLPPISPAILTRMLGSIVSRLTSPAAWYWARREMFAGCKKNLSAQNGMKYVEIPKEAKVKKIWRWEKLWVKKKSKNESCLKLPDLPRIHVGGGGVLPLKTGWTNRRTSRVIWVVAPCTSKARLKIKNAEHPHLSFGVCLPIQKKAEAGWLGKRASPTPRTKGFHTLLILTGRTVDPLFCFLVVPCCSRGVTLLVATFIFGKKKISKIFSHQKFFSSKIFFYLQKIFPTFTF